ncbi:MAG: aminopeptidase P family protein [Rhodospirillales bacterium]|nr:aminopeptidase P family protein [Rhodospirillales bacterium]
MRRLRLAGYVIPHGDEHQNEYVPASAERLRWLTGFSGSAGSAIVLRERAAVFVDGRYTVQAAAEVAASAYEIRHVSREPPADWIAEHLPAGGRLGYDPWLFTPAQVAALEAACHDAEARAVAVPANLIDTIWRDRPPPPVAPMAVHPLSIAGQSAADKRAQIGEMLRERRQDAAVLSAPDSIAWLLNIRGGDLPHVPVTLAFAIITADGSVTLFVDPGKVTPAVQSHFASEGGISLSEPTALPNALRRLGEERRRVRIDPERSPAAIKQLLKTAGGIVVSGPDPCLKLKAIKNPVEQDGMRAAHRRDGAALAAFLAWLAQAAPSGAVSETTAVARLEACRRRDPLYRGPSFPTIAAAGPNGAVVHYRVTAATDRPLVPGSLFLLDSGGQYADGTTDVTRTVAIGAPTAEMRERLTLVLKGHIGIATLRFPKGTTGTQIDAFARLALWQAGLDYDHGTGHGVGAYLSVHEGPQSISKMPNRTALEPGMVLSNEPGYYKTGAYGIRIENLVLVSEAFTPEGGEHELLSFETLTLAPIDRALILAEMLTPAEREWLDAYHARVRATMTPLVDRATAAWLSEVTAPLAG